MLVEKKINIKSIHIFESALVDCSKAAFSQFCPNVDIFSFDFPFVLEPFFFDLPLTSSHNKSNDNGADDESCKDYQQTGHS